MEEASGGTWAGSSTSGSREGFLKLRTRWNYDEAAKVVRPEVEQLQAGAPFRMPIEVGFDMVGEATPNREDRNSQSEGEPDHSRGSRAEGRDS